MGIESKFRPVNLISELTSRCNLRCRYCPKGDSHSESWNLEPGRNLDMEGSVLEKYIESAKKINFEQIQLSGIGEFSFRPDWVDIGRSIRNQCDSKISLVSNFARIFNTDELDFLLDTFYIMISVDTPDSGLLREVRKSVDIRNITTNIVNLRARALETKRELPILKLHATLYVENMLHIYALACYAVAVNVSIFQIARVSLDGDENTFPTPLQSATPGDAVETLRQLDLAKNVCAAHGVEFIEFGDLRSILVDISESKDLSSAKEHTEAAQVTLAMPDGARTRLCLQPWNTINVGASGKVFPCCVGTDDVLIGNLQEESIESIINGDTMLSLKRELLTGKLRKVCLECHNAPMTPVSELQQALETYFSPGDILVLVKRILRHRIGAFARKILSIRHSLARRARTICRW